NSAYGWRQRQRPAPGREKCIEIGTGHLLVSISSRQNRKAREKTIGPLAPPIACWHECSRSKLQACHRVEPRCADLTPENWKPEEKAATSAAEHCTFEMPQCSPRRIPP